MKIYTKVGDKGRTFLANNRGVWKDSARIETYGTIDELNCFLGITVARIGVPKKAYQKYLSDLLINTQKDLFYIGAFLADPESKIINISLGEKISGFEKQIDEMTKKLPILHNFILPGGGRLGAFLHIARAVCRRAERNVVSLSRSEKIDETLLVYFNRLSDLLFTMARFANYNERQKEVIWKK